MPERFDDLVGRFDSAVVASLKKATRRLALRWRDLDWSARRVAVHHTLVRMGAQWWLGDPKTVTSRRSRYSARTASGKPSSWSPLAIASPAMT